MKMKIMKNGKHSPQAVCVLFTASLLATLLSGCGGSGDSNGSTNASPTVVSSNPSNGATNIPTSTNSSSNVMTGTLVTATFNQSMDPATINSVPAGTQLTFTLMETTGNDVHGTVSMNASSKTATFTPTAGALISNTSYTATVTTAARNGGGTAMANTVTWSFTTRAVAFTGQAPVNLDSAGNFVILSKAGISTVPTSAITGDIGVSPIDHTAITGFSETADASNTFSRSTQVIGKLYAADYTPPTPTYMTTAINDMELAYADAAGRTFPNFFELGAGEIGGLTLVPGLYKWSSGVMISTDVTLSGGPDDVWIFQIAGDITQAAATNVILAGGALPKNIYWQTFGTVAIGTTAHFEGIILSQTSISLGTGGSMNGRLLAGTAITLDQNAVTQPAP